MCENRIKLNRFESSGARRVNKGIIHIISSKSEWSPAAEIYAQLFDGDNEPLFDYAFHTKKELNPSVIIDLTKSENLFGLTIHNRKGEHAERAENLTVWISNDGVNWELKWSAPKVQNSWDVPFTQSKMGATVLGIETRYIKVGLSSSTPNYMHLPRIEIYVK